MRNILSEPVAAPSRIPLCKPYISEEEEKAAAEVLRSGWVMQGPKVEQFEQLIAEYVGVKHAIAVNSGTSALSIAYAASELEPDDRVVMPSHSFVATANSALHCSIKPTFIDIKTNHYNIDPSKIPSAIEPRTRGLMIVHQIGFPAEMKPLMSTAKKYNLIVMEDAACSLGATYDGRQTGSFGLIACLSFHPRKVITTGEGGMVLTNSDRVAEFARSARNHGLIQKGQRTSVHCAFAGFNYRMTDIQAAIGIVQFKKLSEIIRLRTRLADRYREEIEKVPALRLPEWPDEAVPNYQSFVVDVADDKLSRDRILSFMNSKGVDSKPGIQPIHQEPAYSGLASDDDLHETSRVAKRSLFLPLYPGMTDEEQDVVLRVLHDAVDQAA